MKGGCEYAGLKKTKVELTAVYPHKILRQAFRRFVLGWESWGQQVDEIQGFWTPRRITNSYQNDKNL
jgi:hypothetical protein